MLSQDVLTAVTSSGSSVIALLINVVVSCGLANVLLQARMPGIAAFSMRGQQCPASRPWLYALGDEVGII